MEKYKQRKQTNNLLRVFLLTFFTFASLFSVTGIVYSLVTVGIGSPLFLLCSIGFATCTTLSACNAYAIRNNITHRRGSKASKKEIACSTNTDLIDFSSQSILNEEHSTQKYSPHKTSREVLIPEVVKSTNPSNEPKLKLLNSSNSQVTITNDKRASQNLKSPNIPQTQGSNFAGPTRGIAIQQLNNPVILHQPQKNSTLPMLEINMVNKSKTLLQSQNISNPSKSTAPIPPPMPKVNIADKSRISPQSQLYDTDDLAIPTTYPQSENNLSVIQPDRSLLFRQIREIGKNNLRKVDPVKSTGTFKTPLQLSLEKRAEAFATSWSESDSLTSGPDWEEEVETPFETREESSNKSTEDYVEGSNRHIDSAISDGESSPERNNISKDIQLKNSLPHSLSNNDIKGSVEQPQGPLSCSSSCPSFIAINMNTL